MNSCILHLTTAFKLLYHLYIRSQWCSGSFSQSLYNRASCHIESKHFSASRLQIYKGEPLSLKYDAMSLIRTQGIEVPVYTLDLLAIRLGENHITKVTLGLQNHWRMTNSGVGIVPRDLALAEIRSNHLLGRRRGWH